MKKHDKIIIGLVSYGDNTAKYLPFFLSSLSAQTYQDFETVVIDNTETEDNANRDYYRDNYPWADYLWAGGNLGFAKAYNRLIHKAKNKGGGYFLMLNQDMILEPDAIEKLADALATDDSLGSVCPKIMSWDFSDNRKTDLIDTAGIALKPGLKFVDFAQGEKDTGQCKDAPIIGPSGAAGLFRMSALESVAENGWYFDEKMFMYKEDCDLAYRLFLKDWKTKCVESAVIYHDRTAKASGESDVRVALNRKNKSRQVKIWSFKNQQIIFKKHWKTQGFSGKAAIIFYQAKMIAYVLLFERYLLKELMNVWFDKNKGTLARFWEI